MKHWALAFVAVFLGATSLFAENAEPQVQKVRVFIVAGQSNAAGRAAGKMISPEYKGQFSEVDFCLGQAEALRPLAPGGHFGPEVTFGHHLHSALGSEPGTKIVIVKTAAGGTSLMYNWRGNGTADREKDGNLYIGLQKSVEVCRELIKAKYPDAAIHLDGMLWVQGESDLAGGRSGLYEENLRRFIKDTRATFGDDLRFVISRLSSSQTGYKGKASDNVRAAQDKVAGEDERNGLVNTDGFGVQDDGMHYNAAGQEAIGKAAAAEMLRLLNNKEKPTTSTSSTTQQQTEAAEESDVWPQDKSMLDPMPLRKDTFNQLLALDASCTKILRAEFGRSPKRMCIRHWNDAGQTIAWNVTSPEAARYFVTLLINPGRNETKLRISTATGGEVITTIPGLGWQRLEIPEMLELPAGENRVTLSLIEPTGTVELKSIELVEEKSKKALEERVAAFKGDTSWMKTAGYGIMVQTGGWAYPPEGDKKPWPAFAEEFDAAAFVQKVDEMGGKFLVWSVTWADYLFPAPIESIAEHWPNRVSKRDLVGELARECRKRNIRFILYYHMGHGCGDVRTGKGWLDGRTQSYAERLKWLALEQKIFREIGERYGELLDGYFIDDGCVWYPCDFEEIGAALKAGNSKRVICYNPADGPNLTPFQDFYAGEAFHGPGPRGQLDDGVMQTGGHRGLQLWGCFKFDGPWGIEKPNVPVGKPGRNWSVESLERWTKQLESQRFSIAANITMYEDGTISPESYQMFREAAQRLGRGAWSKNTTSPTKSATSDQ